MGTVEIFIDAEYVLQSLRTLADKPAYVNIRKEDFNWPQFIRYILGARPIMHVNYYTARLDKNENETTYNNQTAFLQQVETTLAPFKVQMRLGKMIKIRNKTQRTWNEQRHTTAANHNTFSWGQKGIDTKIILDMCRFAYENAASVDGATAILVSGDEDFAEVLALLQEKHITTELVSFNRRDSHLSDALQEKAAATKLVSYNDCIQHNFLPYASARR